MRIASFVLTAVLACPLGLAAQSPAAPPTRHSTGHVANPGEHKRYLNRYNTGQQRHRAYV